LLLVPARLWRKITRVRGGAFASGGPAADGLALPVAELKRRLGLSAASGGTGL
jgi:hypothetical protein